MTNYKRGYSLEWKAKRILDDNGYMVFRSPASKSPADIIAFNKKRKLMIQCKKTSKDTMYIYELDALIKSAKQYGATPLIVYSLRYTPIYVKKVSSEKESFTRDGDNIGFERYLKEEI